MTLDFAMLLVLGQLSVQLKACRAKHVCSYCGLGPGKKLPHLAHWQKAYRLRRIGKDHFFPKCKLEGRKLHEFFPMITLIPCCTLCNTIKGERIFWDLDSARAYILEERKKYFSRNPRVVPIMEAMDAVVVDLGASLGRRTRSRAYKACRCTQFLDFLDNWGNLQHSLKAEPFRLLTELMRKELQGNVFQN